MLPVSQSPKDVNVKRSVSLTVQLPGCNNCSQERKSAAVCPVSAAVSATALLLLSMPPTPFLAVWLLWYS